MTKSKGPLARARRKIKREADAALYRSMIAELRERGASCATCQHYAKAPMGLEGHQCELGEDHGWYQIVSASHVCTNHQSKIAK